jgi:shikimate dehydrogenase
VLNAAVLGQPIAHSLSPVLHDAGYRALGLQDWRYAAHELGAAELPGWVAGLDETWRGLSLTMPLKEVAFEVATTVSDTARQTGAINTLVRRADLGWDAHNTDVPGLVESVRLAVRSQVRPETVALAADLGLTVEVLPLEEWALTPVRLYVSTLPPQASASTGASLGETGSRFNGATLLDVVYAGWPTPLARDAAAVGMTTIGGLDMLVHQAAEQFRLFTGEPAPVDAMFAAGREALAS